MSAGTTGPAKPGSTATETPEVKRGDLPSPYTPIDQSVFEHQTGETEDRLERRRREKEELQRQQQIISLVAGIVVGLVVVVGIVAIIINSLQ